jgi:N-acetylneuraminic acid mutarotase
MFAVTFIWLYTPAAGQIPLPDGGDLTAPAAHIPDAPDTFSEADLPGGDLTWKLLAPLSIPRYALAAAAAPDGSIFVIGGADVEVPEVLAVVEVYRPGSNQWRAAPSLPRPRARLAAATGGDGRIYAIGGWGDGLLNSVLALTPGADRWVAVAPMSVGRQLLGATAGADGRIYVVGGHNNLGGALNLLEIYDPARDQWTPGAPMPTPRYGMGVALGGDGRIYAIGGVGADDVVEAYSPATDSWATVAPLPSRRPLLSAVAGPDERIYVLGGCEFVAGNSDCIYTRRVDVYSPQTNVWQTLSPTITAHREGAATTDGKSIFAIGGSATDVVESATPVPVEAQPMVILPYLSTGYRSLVVPQGGGPTGFEQPSFNDSGFQVSDAAFGSGGDCPLDSTVQTSWPVETDILLRKTFTLPATASNVTVAVAVDNDIQVFINGTDISGGLQPHEFCATRDSFIFPVPNGLLVFGGSNLLAVRTRDRGSISYVDVEVRADRGVLNDFVSFEPIPSTFTFTPAPTGCLEGFAGTFGFEAQLTNISTSALSDLVVTVTTLTNGNLLLNADSGPAGVGAQLTVPPQDGFGDGVLSPEEFVKVAFIICLTQQSPFRFVVDVLGKEE